MTDTTSTAEPTAEAVAEQVFGAFLGGQQTLSCYVGERLGWYAALAGAPRTAAELAEATGTDERYAREWLEMQAVFGILTVDDPDASATRRSFSLPAGAREALLDHDSLAYVGALPRLLAASGRVIDPLLAAYRSGAGLGWGELGPDAFEAQAALNRPWFLGRLAAALASVPDLDALLREPGARLLDVGCGGGWASIALARAYPQAEVSGVDVDLPSLELARRNAADQGVRVEFRALDAAEQGPNTIDAAFLFECLHDMPQPVAVLAALRRALRPGGTVVVMDEGVADRFVAPGDEVEQLMYGFSLFVCLPDGRAHHPSAATGTVMRRSTLESYASQAGFSRVDMLPIEGFSFFRFYRLHPQFSRVTGSVQLSHWPDDLRFS